MTLLFLAKSSQPLNLFSKILYEKSIDNNCSCCDSLLYVSWCSCGNQHLPKIYKSNAESSGAGCGKHQRAKWSSILAYIILPICGKSLLKNMSLEKLQEDKLQQEIDVLKNYLTGKEDPV